MIFKIIKDSVIWEKYLNTLKIKDIYFTYNYLKIDSQINKGIPELVYFEYKGNKIFHPYVKRKIDLFSFKEEYYDISTPYGYGGYLIDINNDIVDKHQFIKKFFDLFDKYCLNNNIILEFVRFHPLYSPLINEIKDFINVSYNRKTVVIDLNNDYKTVKSNYKKNNKYAIKKSEKENLKSEFLFHPDRNELLKFIELYYETMKNVGALDYYYFDKNYFFELFDKLKNSIFLVNIFKENILINSGMFFLYSNNLHYHLSARKQGYSNLNPNNYMLDKVVKFGIENNVKYFHLGGGNSDSDTDGLFKFKKSFSDKLLDFYIGKKIYNLNIYNELKRIFLDNGNLENNKLIFYRTN